MKIKLNLRFFDGAAAGSAPAAEATGGAESTQQAAAKATPEDRASAYAKFKAEYKSEFSKDFEAQLGDRLKSHAELKNRMKALDPILSALGSKYGADPSDIESLQRAIDSDESYFEREAEEEGLTVAQLKEQKRLREQVEAFKAEKANAEREAATRQKLVEWGQQGEQLKALYPDFDLGLEANNPDTGEKFLALLKGGLVGVQDAYELVHPEARDARIQRGTAIVAKLSQQQTLDTIKAKGMRPSENGAGGNASAVTFDPNKMTPEQRREINLRAMRGEAIDLRTKT